MGDLSVEIRRKSDKIRNRTLRQYPHNCDLHQINKPKMTYWADNIRFIKEVQDSKYEKIEEAIVKLNEQLEILGKDEADPKAREIFHEASRTLEMANPDDLQALGETMFQDMHECPEKQKEVDRLTEVQDKL